MDEQGLGHKLQTLRQAAGLTQQELCHQAKLSFSTLTKIERGAIKSPSIFTVKAIAEVLAISLDELIMSATPPSTPRRQLVHSKSGISFVYFDLNGCLIHFFQRAFLQLAADTGVTPDVVESAFWHYNADVCRGIITIEEFNQQLAQRIGVPSVNWEKYYLDTVEPITPMQELLIWASQRYRIGLLTNTMPGLVEQLRSKHQLPNVQFDALIDSSVVAAIKPEAKIYEIAQARANAEAAQILLIDDSRVNLMAAERLGWHVLWFDDAQSEDSVERIRTALEPATSP